MGVCKLQSSKILSFRRAKMVVKGTSAGNILDKGPSGS